MTYLDAVTTLEAYRRAAPSATASESGNPPRYTAPGPADDASCAGLPALDGDSHPTVNVVTCTVGLDSEMWPLKVCTLPFTTVRIDQSAGLSPP